MSHLCRGFTLIEVLVALTIGGMAVAGAAALLHGLGDRAESIDRAASHVDASANGERFLRELAGNLDLGTDTMAPVLGGADSVEFRAWCQVPAGWLDHCAVRLSMNRGQDTAALGVEFQGAYSGVLTLRRGFGYGRFLYLEERDQRFLWAGAWTRRTAPRAIGIILGADTLLLPVHGDD